MRFTSQENETPLFYYCRQSFTSRLCKLSVVLCSTIPDEEIALKYKSV